jgi:ferredoxin-NADP reductase
MAVQPWRHGDVIAIEEEAELTRRFRIRIPELERFDFTPGQFVTLDLPISDKPARRMRSYSIASWPDGTNSFELLISLQKEGIGTPYLFDEVNVGSTLTLRGPQGSFILPDPLDRDLFLVCTGTGIAPFRSMVHHIARHKVPHQAIHLIFGARHRRNLLYHEEMKAMERLVPDFHFHPVLSREKWEGREGYVHPVYEELANGKQPAYFYLCGWKNMIDEAKHRIQDLGYDRTAIHQEIYG